MHLPDGYLTSEGLKESLISSQLLQAMETMDTAIMSPESTNILQSFEMFDYDMYADSEDRKRFLV